MKRLLATVALLFCLAASSAWAQPASVSASILPQRYFLDKIAGPLADVSIMVEPGASPHAYEPRPKQMTALAQAKAYFAINDAFEHAWLDRIASVNKNMLLVRTDAGIHKLPMAERHHEGEHAEEHDHGRLDPHIWLDPSLVKVQAANIRDGLAKVDPANAATYRANCEAFQAELDRLDAEIRAILEPVPPEKRRFMVFHPSWGYFARAYDLTQIPIEVAGKEPSARELAELIEHVRQENVPVVFVQPQFSAKSAEVLARALNARVVRLDPLAEDWDDNLRRAARVFREAMQ